MRYIGLCSLIILPLLTGGCGIKDKRFEKEFIRWQEDRTERLKSRTGWLNLAGLFWLEEGENTIGSDSSNSIIFPETAPGRIGKYRLDSNKIYFIANPASEVCCENNPVSEMEITTDKSGDPTLLVTGSLEWFIIERPPMFGIRLRDYDNPAIRNFHGTETFPADRNWLIRAEFEAFDKPREMLIPTVIGTVEMNLCPGVLRFKIDGAGQELYPTVSGDELFIIFADGTSGIETYPGGRFIYTPVPDRKGRVTIDFNRAYNPPCAFTPFATCPLPPRENILTEKIEAGEKFSGH